MSVKLRLLTELIHILIGRGFENIYFFLYLPLPCLILSLKSLACSGGPGVGGGGGGDLAGHVAHSEVSDSKAEVAVASLSSPADGVALTREVEGAGVFEVEVLNSVRSNSSVPLKTSWRSHEINMLTRLELSHLDVPLSGELVVRVHLEHHVVAQVAAGDVHVLTRVVSTDDWRSHAT